jgi:sterol desaturase/sphingolipid hydroxylase (fatty acid hydroxylase superfamily)
VPGFLARVVAANAAQFGVVVLAGLTWDRAFAARSLLDLGARLPPWQGAVLAYLVSTLVYYGWHRLRHESPFFWRFCHQLHHSPRRIEALTSFYKHPLEFVANSLLSAGIAYGLCGLSVEGAGLFTFLCAAAEFFYHLNVRTPRWVGWFVQRPEMHRIHHEAGRHAGNYGDLPLWDMIFGTYENPDRARAEAVVCGFAPADEARVEEMLRGVDLHRPARDRSRPKRRRWARRLPAALLLGLGVSQMVGAALGSPTLRGLGALSVAAPLPLVFTQFRGYETYAADFTFDLETVAGTRHAGPITPALSASLGGPYNRRNPYGAVLAYGPVLDAPGERVMVDAVLRFGLCDDGPFARALGLEARVTRGVIVARSRTAGDPRTHVFTVECAR